MFLDMPTIVIFLVLFNILSNGVNHMKRITELLNCFKPKLMLKNVIESSFWANFLFASEINGTEYGLNCHCYCVYYWQERVVMGFDPKLS